MASRCRARPLIYACGRYGAGVITAAMLAAGRDLSDPRLSPDGERVAFVSSAGGRNAIVLVPAGGGPERRLTSEPEPSSGRLTSGAVLDWLPDGSALVYAARDGNLWVQPVTGGPAGRITDQPKGAGANAPAVSPDGTCVAYVVDDRHVAVASLESHGPWPVRISAADAEFSFDPSWSADAQFVAWHAWRPPHMAWDESSWVVAGADGSGPVAEYGGDGLAVSQPRFSPVGSDLAFVADRTGFANVWLFGPDRDVERPLVDEPFEHAGPSWGQGQRSVAWSPDGTALAFTRNEGGFGRLCVVDVATRTVREVAKAVHGGLSWRGARLAALRSGGTTPTQLVTYDAGTHGEGTWARTVLAIGPVAGYEPHLVEPTPVTWPGDDGADVHGRLYRPTAADGAVPGPLLVWVHGGPTDQTAVSFNARLAFWLSRGWSVLFPDHRGSTGWGRAYTQALTGRWGELDSADVAAAVRVAVDRGWGRADSVVAMGGSAGGLTVLNLLAHHDVPLAAGVVLYPVTDLRALDEATHRFEAHYTGILVGPWPAAAATYRARSPLFHADGITAPLLVLHGDADPVVAVGQSEALVAALRARGRDVTFHVYPGEGHGWGNPSVTADELARTEAFLARHVPRPGPLP